MGWGDFTAYVAVSVAVLILPGFLVALAAGIRITRALALAGPVTLGLLAASAIVLHDMGYAFSIHNELIICGGAIVVAFLAGLPWIRSRDRMRTPWIAYIASCLVATGIMWTRLAYVLGRPDSLQQMWDSFLHANAVQWVARTGDGSSLSLRQVDNADKLYPAAWHDFGAMVSNLMGSVSVIPAMNASLFAITLMWVLGVAELARTLYGNRRSAYLAAACGAVAFSAFPTGLLWRGPLYPFLTGLACIPALTAALLSMFRLDKDKRKGWWAPEILPTVCGIIGMILAHPSAFVFFVFIADVMLVVWALHRWKWIWLRMWLIPPAIYGTWKLFYYFRPADQAVDWPPSSPGNWYHQLWYVLWNTGPNDQITHLVGYKHGVFAAVLVLLGIASCCLRPRRLWFIPLYLATAFVWRFTAGWEHSRFRYLLSGTWRCDEFRLAAMFSIAALPLAMGGVVFLLEWITPWAPKAAVGLRDILVAIVTLGLLFPASYCDPSLHQISEQAHMWHRYPPREYLDKDKLALFAQIPGLVEPDDQILAIPWNGGSFVYAYTARRSPLTHVSSGATPDTAHVLATLTKPTMRTCQIVRDNRIKYVLDFGEPLSVPYANIKGIQAISTTPGFTVMASTGPKATLYRIDICG